MIKICSNDRTLFISKQSSIEKGLDDEWIPSVVLLTAWDLKSTSPDYWGETVVFLLDQGATYFVCVGALSEELHDQIDNLLYQLDIERGINLSEDIVTTFHSNDTLTEAVHFFVSLTELRNKSNGCLIAILDEDNPNDEDVKEMLKNS